jgi:hypothetical protein
VLSLLYILNYLVTTTLVMMANYSRLQSGK